MAKKVFTAIIDCETFMDDTICDFSIIVIDSKGNIHSEMAVLLEGFGTKPLFHDAKADNIWSLRGLQMRTERYNAMLTDGRRTLASVAAVNRWLARMQAKYNTGNSRLQSCAYNSAFDWDKMEKTGIDHALMSGRFCLWQLFCGIVAQTKDYKEFILANHYWGNVTALRNCCYQTSAQVAAHYVRGYYEEEPHDARGDLNFEKDIFLFLAKKKGYMSRGKTHNWRDYQVKNNFVPK